MACQLSVVCCILVFCFFKQKTAYEMRISDWSSDVCSSDLPMHEVDLRAWRRQIGYVPQETLLLNGTVAENIAWGQPAASRDEIEAAARMANADEFIRRMPRGYDTQIGGRNISMSGDRTSTRLTHSN